MRIAIVYDSGYGHTAKQAQAVAEGVRQVKGAEVSLIAIQDGAIPWETLEASDMATAQYLGHRVAEIAGRFNK